MTSENLLKLWEEFVKETNRLGEVEWQDLIAPPIPCFGVEQQFDENGIPKKLRRIANFKKANLGSPLWQKLRLTSQAGVQEAVQICLQEEPSDEFLPIVQSAKDVIFDIEKIEKERKDIKR